MTVQPLLTFFCLVLGLVLLGWHADRGAVAMDQRSHQRRVLDRRTAGREAFISREYFYTGGRYVDNGQGETGFEDQMYVEKLSPERERPDAHPMIFIHGAGQTGTNWLNKPDGSPGWASYFVQRGHTLYLIDQTARGRSPWKPGDGNLSSVSAEFIQQQFTAPENYNQWPQAKLHTQWPGTGMIGDPYFDAYYASVVPSLASDVDQQTALRAAGISLLERIGEPVILLAHSQGGVMPWLMADARPESVKAIVSIEPAGPPFQNAGAFGNGSARRYGLTDIPLAYNPPLDLTGNDLVTETIPAPDSLKTACILQAKEPAPRQLANLPKIPVLVVTAEASYHAPYDYCIVNFLEQAGVNVTHLELGKAGIRGNGHLLFLEKNSDEIAEVLEGWVKSIR